MLKPMTLALALGLSINSNAIENNKKQMLINNNSLSNLLFDKSELYSLADTLAVAAVDASNGMLNIDILNELEVGNNISISLPGETLPSVLLIEKITHYDQYDMITYDGSIAGDQNSYFTLSLDAEGITGKAALNNYTYMFIKTDELIDQVIIKIDPRLVPQNPDDYQISSSSEHTNPSTEEQTKDNDVIERNTSKMNSHRSASNEVKILFLYTTDAYNGAGTAATMISQFNTALSNSGVNNYTVSAARFIPIDTSFGTLCVDDVYENMFNKTGIFSDLDTRRDLADADIAVTIMNDAGGDGSSGCRVGGKANLKSDVANNQDPVAVVADSFILGDNTGAHEVGHILGGYHANEDNFTPAFKRGIRNTSGEWQSMMGGYSGGCAFKVRIIRV